MNQGTIRTQKTARYFTLGTLNQSTEEVWIVLHGYAQLANDFLENFGFLEHPSRFVIAPEALNRFYAKGFGGKPAATWMTSEAREDEIKDYIQYLDNLYLGLNLPATARKIFLLGFSQGVATATRWLHHTQHRVDELIICSGEIARELQNPLSPKLKSIPLTYITGNNDRLIDGEKHKAVLELMEQLNARIIRFDGGHEINARSIKDLL
jgi:predicted esterase